MKHFKLTKTTLINSFGNTLYQIKATKTFQNNNTTILKGTLGGYIENLKNLQENAWVSGNARVYGDARVSGNAHIYSNKDYMLISNLGDNFRTITLTKSNKKIKCGCSIFSLGAFKKAVRKKYKNPEKDNYYFVFDLIEKFFNS